MIKRGGHGSHTSGSLAGNYLDESISEFNGMAEDAKIMFIDIECQNPSGFFELIKNSKYKV